MKVSLKKLVKEYGIIKKWESYRSIIERMRFAWDVLTYRADPLYWYFERGFKRTTNGFKKITMTTIKIGSINFSQDFFMGDPEYVQKMVDEAILTVKK